MKEQNLEPNACPRRLDRIVSRFRCWWFGCELHPQDSAPPEYAECQHCGMLIDYESMAGITRYSAAKDFFSYWLFRKWWPRKCGDCGKRFGDHSRCIPF